MITNRDKVLNLLGLAQKAGKISSGNDLVISAMKTNKAALVLLATELSANSQKEFNYLSEKYEVPVNYDFTEQELSNALGKKRKIIAVLDQGFKKAIMAKLEKESD